MTVASGPLLLDTGILVLLCRGGEPAQRLNERYGINSRPAMPWISVVTVGELLAFSLRNRWGSQKLAVLRDLIENLVVVDVKNEAVLNAYARLDATLHSAGRRFGQQNDLWIAATAAATGAVLLTTDADFDILHPHHLRRERVDQASLRD